MKPISTLEKSIIEQNFNAFLKLAPGIEEKLLSFNPLTELLSGKSSNTEYKDFEIKILKREGDLFYLTLSQSSTEKAKPAYDNKMDVLLNLNGQLEALSFENIFQKKAVYDDMYLRTVVNPQEFQGCNAYLLRWLAELAKQGHKIEWTVHLPPDLPTGVQPDAQEPEELPVYDDLTNMIAHVYGISLFEALNKTIEVVAAGKYEAYFMLIMRYYKGISKDVDTLARINYDLLEVTIPDLKERLQYPYSYGSITFQTEGFSYDMHRCNSYYPYLQNLVIIKGNEPKSSKMLLTFDLKKRRVWISIISNWFHGIPDYWNDAKNVAEVVRFQRNYQLTNFLEWLFLTKHTLIWHNHPSEGIVPDFQPGYVQLTPAHINAGVEQKHIEYINRFQKGLAFNSPRQLADKEPDLETRIAWAMQKPGFSVDKKGRIHHRNRYGK